MPRVEAQPEWALDLVHPDAGRRGRALAENHRRYVEAVAARHRANQMWLSEEAAGRSFASSLARQAAEATFQRLYERTLGAWLPTEHEGRSRDRPPAALDAFGIVYLQWESEFTAEFDSASHDGSRWSAKESCLRRFGHVPVGESDREPLRGLLLSALRRGYRCKDWHHAAVARQVDDEDLRQQISRLVNGDDLVRAQSVDPRETAGKAAFVLHVLADPGLIVKLNSWDRWLKSHPG